MDTKNIIAAISLSAAVIILYSLFFAPTPQERKQIQSEKNKTTQNTSGDAPSLAQNNEAVKISDSLISLESLLNIYPPLVPLMLLTKLFFLILKKFVLNKVMKYFVVKIHL